MSRTLTKRIGVAARRVWLALALVADDDGLETDYMPPIAVALYPTAMRTAVPILAHYDA